MQTEYESIILRQLKINLSKLVKGEVKVFLGDNMLVVDISHKDLIWRFSKKNFNFYAHFYGDSARLTNEIVSLYRRQITKHFFK